MNKTNVDYMNKLSKKDALYPFRSRIPTPLQVMG